MQHAQAYGLLYRNARVISQENENMPRLHMLAGALAAALVFGQVAHAGTFKNVVVFGDSLSDDGNVSLALGASQPMRYTTNPGQTAIEHVAGVFGVGLSPSLSGGSDYAWGGAGIIDNTPGAPATIPTISAQINDYLAAGGTDPDALYSVWGGANDIFYHATAAAAAAQADALVTANTAGLPAAVAAQVAAQIRSQVASTAGVSALESADQAQAHVANAAAAEVGLIGQLQSAGARHILVFNLPDIGSTPQATAQGAEAAQSLSGLSLIYNSQLNTGLGQLGDGIVPVDVYGLFKEIMANPSTYGFSNVTAPACGAGSSSVQCGPEGSGAPYTYADGTQNSYLFADGVHPTTAAHALLGQYIAAELAAPAQISLLAEAPLAFGHFQTSTLDQQMTADVMGAGTRVFARAGYARQTFDSHHAAPGADSDNANLSIGAATRAGEHVSMGVALGLGHASADLDGRRGGYKLTTVNASGYAMYHQGGGFVGVYAGFGQLNYKDIDRRFALGTAVRTESGKTDGSQLLGGLTAGWWFGSGHLKTGPVARFEWQHVRINGYSEHSADSSAMWYGRLHRYAAVGSLGWRLSGHWQAGTRTLSPYVALTWHHDSRAQADKVRAGLVDMNGHFTLDGFTADKSWGSADLGLAMQVTPSTSTWIGYQGHFSDDTQKLNALNVGFRHAF